MKKLYLIGFMGCGKTSTSHYLSKKTGLTHVDIDELVEKNQQKKIKSIFQEDGEAVFRQYESETLMAINDAVIVSTGGGIVERVENIQFMKETGVLIYLKTSLEIIKQRITNDGTRPLWNNSKDINSLYEKRTRLYEMNADYIIDCDDMTIEEVGLRILELSTYKAVLKREE
ncbi:shikimate kinase [Ornithinibacillus halotolerans]|uniref:Shikimate kinase n=1 Tax=Ornithinibacillus halotolerans TaxID=1274357 RepID=A0A916RT14_9BACI|nr:shikimate kinase [Ornithinibacillus halotolerans]GGA68290.1 shikimate kinase [Ornithinibacillus halotolerans]